MQTEPISKITNEQKDQALFSFYAFYHVTLFYQRKPCKQFQTMYCRKLFQDLNFHFICTYVYYSDKNYFAAVLRFHCRSVLFLCKGAGTGQPGLPSILLLAIVKALLPTPPIYLHLIFAILQFEISNWMNWIFFLLSLNWIFYCKVLV